MTSANAERTQAVVRARARKVDRLVGVALRVGATAEIVASDADVRSALARAAGVREPSLITWQQVVGRLAAPHLVDRLTGEVYAAYARRTGH